MRSSAGRRYSAISHVWEKTEMIACGVVLVAAIVLYTTYGKKTEMTVCGVVLVAAIVLVNLLGTHENNQ